MGVNRLDVGIVCVEEAEENAEVEVDPGGRNPAEGGGGGGGGSAEPGSAPAFGDVGLKKKKEKRIWW